MAEHPYYRGAFSIVKRCVHRKSNEQYAAKIINKRRLSTRGTTCDTYYYYTFQCLFRFTEIGKGRKSL